MKKMVIISLVALGLVILFSIDSCIKDENNRKSEETNRLFIQNIPKRDEKNELLAACYKESRRVGLECMSKSREEGGAVCGEEKIKYELEKLKHPAGSYTSGILIKLQEDELARYQELKTKCAEYNIVLQ